MLCHSLIHSCMHMLCHSLIHSCIHMLCPSLISTFNLRFPIIHTLLPVDPLTHLSINPPIHQSTHPSIHPSINPLIHQSTHPSIHPSINPPIHQSTHPSIHPTINPPIHQFTQPPIHQSTQPPIHLPYNPHTHPPITPLTINPDFSQYFRGLHLDFAISTDCREGLRVHQSLQHPSKSSVHAPHLRHQPHRRTYLGAWAPSLWSFYK